jgi:nucleoside-diphosphate-sugar epimerase
MTNNQKVVVVTGSSGLIGYAVANRLAEEYKVFGFDRQGPPHPPPSTECVEVDLTSEESVRQGLETVRRQSGEHIASVIHLAAYYDFSGRPSRKYEEITVKGTQRLLRSLQHFQVDQFVFSSTMLVHRPVAPGRRIHESSPLDPRWDYPWSKVKTEELIRTERRSIPSVMLRISGVYDDMCHSIPLAQQMQRIYERRLTSRFFPGDLSRGQAFLHLKDLEEAVVRVVDRRARLPSDSVFLLGEPDIVSYGELQRIIGRLIHGEDWKTYRIPKPLAKLGAWLQQVSPWGKDAFIRPWMIDFADDHYALDITPARRMLEWEPQRSLRETLPKMIAALKTDPIRWYQENRLKPPRWLKRQVRPMATSGSKRTRI